MPDQQIKVGDTVYQKRRGVSGVAMRVIALREKPFPNGVVSQALCQGVGWGVHDWFAVSNLTHVPDLMMGGGK